MSGHRLRHTVAAMTTTLNRIQDERLAAGLALLITLGALAFANFGGNGDNGGVGPYLVSVGVSAVLAAVLFARVLPNAEPARAAWIMAPLALLTCAIFWSGIPFVLGIGAVYSGARAGRVAPAVLGGIAVVVALVACIVG